ncbi:uncharacterized protein LOC119882714 [Micropterus salmoides]|uniref:uncharacterized protein LOC119882714 n=1 Tax=Micropterus salmoides TaxID=27706 RepID=UPI0018EAA608|nr:uncharacterized protein LOC119882714 [Micropterus salmoides]XP_038548837.1 uncharacterized protein LOC119882714 [Micropterus salmoides]
MEIPTVVNLEGQKFAFSTQELTSESSALSSNGSTDHRGDNCFPEAQSSLMEPDEDLHEENKSFACVSHNNIESAGAVCLQEPEQVSVIPGEGSLDQSPLAPAQLGIVSVQNHSGQTVDLNCRCVKTDFENLEPISNGHVFRPPEDPCSILNLDSTPIFTVSANVPDSSRRVLDLPRIVRHKPSSITFSQYTCPSGANGHAHVNESSDDGATSPEGEEDDDHDDVMMMMMMMMMMMTTTKTMMCF